MQSNQAYDKRNSQPPIPSNLEEYLNIEQKMGLRQIENFGWELKFIRRPPYQENTIVVMGPGGQPIGVLEADGSINQNSDIVLRD